MISTLEALAALGFIEVRDPLPGLSFQFGPAELHAIESLNRWLVPTVSLAGMVATNRQICMIETDMPLEVESIEQAAAWVVWALDNASRRVFDPPGRPAWIEIGRRNRHLLPWERDRAAEELQRAAYEARPRCDITREWARVKDAGPSHRRG